MALDVGHSGSGFPRSYHFSLGKDALRQKTCSFENTVYCHYFVSAQKPQDTLLKSLLDTDLFVVQTTPKCYSLLSTVMTCSFAPPNPPQLPPPLLSLAMNSSNWL